jgi:hypothetical protein
VLWRWVASVPQRAAGSRCGSRRLSVIGESGAPAGPPGSGWLDRCRQVRFIVHIPSREVRRRPHTVPSWRAAVNGEPRRRGTGMPPCRRVDGASGRLAADLSSDPASPAQYRRCRSPDRRWAGRRRAVACPVPRTAPALSGRALRRVWLGRVRGGRWRRGSSPGHGRERPLPPPGGVPVTRNRAPGARSGVRRATPAGDWPARRGCRRARPRRARHPARRCS